MTQQSLNLFLLYVHTARTDALDLSSACGQGICVCKHSLIQLFWEVLELLNFCHAYKVSVYIQISLVPPKL